jgi:hypothetical protein
MGKKVGDEREDSGSQGVVATRIACKMGAPWVVLARKESRTQGEGQYNTYWKIHMAWWQLKRTAKR